jgi:hypothetical protein
MFAQLLTLTLAAGAPALSADRHDASRTVEAHRALVAHHVEARHAAGALYQLTASRTVSDRVLAQRMAVDIGRSLDEGRRELARAIEDLEPARREALRVALSELQERHAQAVSRSNELTNALARAALDGGQVRFLASEIYQSVERAAAAHERVMRQLGITVAEAGAPSADR